MGFIDPRLKVVIQEIYAIFQSLLGFILGVEECPPFRWKTFNPFWDLSFPCTVVWYCMIIFQSLLGFITLSGFNVIKMIDEFFQSLLGFISSGKGVRNHKEAWLSIPFGIYRGKKNGEDRFGRNVSFNPFWDLSVRALDLPSTSRCRLSIPFGIYLMQIPIRWLTWLKLSIPFGIYRANALTVLCDIGIDISFNPFWDLSNTKLNICNWPTFLSIPFGIYHYGKYRSVLCIYNSFNPFWDLSYRHKLSIIILCHFQSLLGFILSINGGGVLEVNGSFQSLLGFIVPLYTPRRA